MIPTIDQIQDDFQNEPYLFLGKVLPERAQLSLSFEVKFKHISSNIPASAKVSIILNQMAVWVDSDHEWDIHDLRNVIANIIRSNLSLIGYLKGYAYNFEITRVISSKYEIDFVFGIDVPCLANRISDNELVSKIVSIRSKTTGQTGLFLSRCFDDLMSSIKSADDTAFYCYRAIESLRHHCAANYGLSEAERPQQWDKFREISGCDKQTILDIKAAADPLRHGNPIDAVGKDRKLLLENTWEVVDTYIENYEVQQSDI